MNRECGCPKEVERCVHWGESYLHLAQWNSGHWQVVSGILVRQEPHTVMTFSTSVHVPFGGEHYKGTSFNKAFDAFEAAERELLAVAHG